MPTRTSIPISRATFLEDRHGRTFADVLNDPQQPFDAVLAFFNNAERQRRMEESELHHDRAPLAGVVRELESEPEIDRFFATQHPQRAKRLRQAVGVVVRIIMQTRGWQTTGKKGSLGVRAPHAMRAETPGSYHNTGGLAFWFLRAERYRRPEGMPYVSVRARNKEIPASAAGAAKRKTRSQTKTPSPRGARRPARRISKPD